jgi:NAD(P)-dependent dehydrogenase (short-subunit alcohol dehydrogenase family)
MSASSSIRSGWPAACKLGLAGKTIVITGTNSGICFETASASAAHDAHDAHVVFAVRNETKGRAAAATVPGSQRCALLRSAARPRVR